MASRAVSFQMHLRLVVSALALLERGAHLCPAALAAGVVSAVALDRDGIRCTGYFLSCWNPAFLTSFCCLQHLICFLAFWGPFCPGQRVATLSTVCGLFRVSNATEGHLQQIRKSKIQKLLGQRLLGAVPVKTPQPGGLHPSLER